MLTTESTNHKILVVDDEPHIVQILKFTLDRAGYQVFTASNGEEGLQQVKELQPDLVILDVMMPIMDGYEVCRRMRDDFKMNQIPIIMLSAKGDLAERVRGLIKMTQVLEGFSAATVSPAIVGIDAQRALVGLQCFLVATEAGKRPAKPEMALCIVLVLREPPPRRLECFVVAA